MKVTVKRTIDAPARGIWAYLADFSNIDRFHPFLTESRFISNSTTSEVGSTRQCDFKDGNSLKEKIIEWVEGSHYKIEIVEATVPFKSAFAQIGVKSQGQNKTETFMTVEIVPNNKLMTPMMYLSFKYKLIPAILKGLENLYHREKEAASSLEMVS